MFDQSSKKLILLLFVFIYIPFLYSYGYKFVSIGNIDFPTLYWAPEVAFQEHRSPYTATAFTETEAISGQKIYPYLYPPPSLLAFYPLPLMSYRAAKITMLLINHACVILFIYLFLFKIRIVKDERHYGALMPALCIVYTLGFNAIIATMQNGQINLVALVLLCSTWHALKRNSRSLMIALPLSLAVLLKTYPVLLIPLLLTRRKYKAVIWVCVLLLLYSIVAYLALPVAVWRDWSVNVVPTGGYGQIPFNLALPTTGINQGINGFASRLFLPSEFSEPLWAAPAVGRALAYMLSLCVIGITMALCYLCSRRSDDEQMIDLEFSLYLLMMFLVAPLSWDHHLVFILPCAIIALYLLLPDYLSLSNKANCLPQMIVMLSLLVLAWDLPYMYVGLRKGLLTLLISVKFYAVVITWLYFAAKLRRYLQGNSINQARKPRIAAHSI